jgi:hypothetical protein
MQTRFGTYVVRIILHFNSFSAPSKPKANARQTPNSMRRR